MCVSGTEAVANPADAGCPQFVQKLVPGSNLLPQFVQNAMDEVAAGAASAGGEAAATKGASSVIGVTAATTAEAGSATDAFSRLPHSVQKTEPESACAPQEEQTGRVTETAAEGCAAAGISLPHDVQKLADSST
jgi:hypothetical protein